MLPGMYKTSAATIGSFYASGEGPAPIPPSGFFLAKTAAGLHYAATPAPSGRANTLLPSPPGAKYKLAVVQFKVPGAKNGGSDKGPDGNRVDSIPIANSVIKAGGACDLLLYDSSGATAAENTSSSWSSRQSTTRSSSASTRASSRRARPRAPRRCLTI